MTKEKRRAADAHEQAEERRASAAKQVAQAKAAKQEAQEARAAAKTQAAAAVSAVAQAKIQVKAIDKQADIAQAKYGLRHLLLSPTPHIGLDDCSS